MRYQTTISLNEVEKARLDHMIAMTELGVIDIFRLGMDQCERVISKRSSGWGGQAKLERDNE